MANDQYRGDFIGFTFGNYTSSDLKIIRVSDGSRYNDDILPSFSDRTVQIIGSDQTYYFGSDFTQKDFSFDIAFDNLKESEFKQLKTVFSTKQLTKLIFDEVPYKYYMVKCSNPPQLKYICFDEYDSDTGKDYRVYKGEGTLSFVAYLPIAKSVHNYLYHFNYEVTSDSDRVSEKTYYTFDESAQKYEKFTGKEFVTGIIYYEKTDIDVNDTQWASSSNMLYHPTIYKEANTIYEETEFSYGLELYKNMGTEESPLYKAKIWDGTTTTDYYVLDSYDTYFTGYKYDSTLADDEAYQRKVNDSETGFIYETWTTGPKYDKLGYMLRVYNASDFDIDFNLTLTQLESITTNATTKTPINGIIYLYNTAFNYNYDFLDTSTSDFMVLQNIDSNVIINSATQLIQGQITTNVYNNCLVDGSIFKLPPGESVIYFYGTFGPPSITYNHYYY